jgi:hypothetical protein
MLAGPLLDTLHGTIIGNYRKADTRVSLGEQKLTGDNSNVVWSEFSALAKNVLFLCMYFV